MAVITLTPDQMFSYFNNKRTENRITWDSANGDSPIGNGLSGNYGNNAWFKTIITFNQSELMAKLNGGIITKATLSLRTSGTNGSAAGKALYKITDTWTKSTVLTEDPGIDDTAVNKFTVTMDSNKQYQINVLSAVLDWVSDSINTADKGLLLTDTGTVINVMYFHSPAANNEDYRPMLTIEYIPNNTPTVDVTSPITNTTLFENDTLNITGTALDADSGDTVTVRYQINALTTRAIKAFLSDGTTLEAFSKTLTFKGGNLYDGTTLIAENLSDGVAHILKVWATDDQGGTSTIREIPFFVVPNRAPLLTVNSPVIDGLINSDKFTVNGAFEDSDGNTTIVSYRINGATSVQIAEGVSGPFTFEVAFGKLVIGENQIVIEAVDSYGAKVSKTIKLNKAAVETPLLKSTARYKINPPIGNAQAVLLWIQRDENLDIDVSISMTMVGEAESFVILPASNTAPIDQALSIVEDEFYHEAAAPKDNIIVQIDMTRSSIEVSDKIHLISGVLE